MGCRSSTGRSSPLRLLPRDVLPFLASPTLGNAAPRSYLLGQHFLEHQRYFAQFHSQSLFSLALLNRLFSILESITVGFSQIHSLNALRNKPRWYNAITTNCTTSIRTQHPPHERLPWDWRILLNGKGDELMYERHLIVTGGLPFAELKTRSLIDTRARAANDSPDFSNAIRAGLPGFY